MAAIHVLEHFYAWETIPALTEWKRILKPGGKLILELPCLDKVFAYIAWCVQNKEGMLPFMTVHALYGDTNHRSVAMCHKVGFFAEDVISMLKHIGMRDVKSEDALYHFRFRDMRITAIKP